MTVSRSGGTKKAPADRQLWQSAPSLVSEATLVRSQAGRAFPGRGAKAYPARAAASVWWAMAEGPMTTAAMVFGPSLPQPATLGYSALTSASAPAVRGYSAEVPPGGQPPVHPTGNGMGVEGRTGGGKGVHGAAS